MILSGIIFFIRRHAALLLFKKNAISFQNWTFLALKNVCSYDFVMFGSTAVASVIACDCVTFRDA